MRDIFKYIVKFTNAIALIGLFIASLIISLFIINQLYWVYIYFTDYDNFMLHWHMRGKR